MRWSHSHPGDSQRPKLTHKCTPSSHSPILFPPQGLPSRAVPGSWNHRRNLPERSPSSSVAKSFLTLGIQKHSLGPSHQGWIPSEMRATPLAPRPPEFLFPDKALPDPLAAGVQPRTLRSSGLGCLHLSRSLSRTLVLGTQVSSLPDLTCSL